MVKLEKRNKKQFEPDSLIEMQASLNCYFVEQNQENSKFSDVKLKRLLIL